MRGGVSAAKRKSPGYIQDLTRPEKPPIMSIEKGAATSGQPNAFRFLCDRNRHRAGWRFLRFTMIVTVKGPICSVIRMSSTPFRVG